MFLKMPSKIEKVWSVNELKSCFKKVGILSKIKSNKQIEYYNYPISFDIETSSFYDNGQKRGIMYIWTMAIGTEIIQGRTWHEFIECINSIVEWYKTDTATRFVIYVHNLPYEFQFLHKYFEFEEVFSTKTRQPIRALTRNGIEFRCSYKLSGYGLAKLSEQLTEHKIKKLVGDLDYKLIRNSKTTLTEKELEYCYNDCLVVNAYIDEYIERSGGIDKIPMTKTGEVRNFMRKKCLYGDVKEKRRDQNKHYRGLIRKLKLTLDDYEQLKRAFAGGFTHANHLYAREEMEDVYSFDFTSSYPAVMVMEKYPMSAPELVYPQSEQEFNDYMNKYCCIFDIEINNLKPKVEYENYLSKSKCRNLIMPVENNGRLVSAKHLITTLTEVDYRILSYMYDWDSIKIFNFKIMEKAYLPTEFVSALLDLYELKTTLKGVEGKEVEYLQSKERINSAYGMCVTDILKDEIKYNPDMWTTNPIDKEEVMEKNNKSTKRFLYYPWGVWVTAYARFNLFTGIIEAKNDYVYVDTDSLKLINVEEHRNYFKAYNELVISKLKKAMQYHRISFDKCAPKTKDGKVKVLGVWDDDGHYERFKTLGAKRYIIEKYNKKGELEVNITVSGLNKQTCVPYLKEKYKDKIFEFFDDELYIPPEYTGKMTHTYIDDGYSGIVEDYQGNVDSYREESGIHLSESDYSLSISQAYLMYLSEAEDVEVPER